MKLSSRRSRKREELQKLRDEHILKEFEERIMKRILPTLESRSSSKPKPQLCSNSKAIKKQEPNHYGLDQLIRPSAMKKASAPAGGEPQEFDFKAHF